METFPPESARLELHESSRCISPPMLKRVLPLRIVKRSDSGCGEPDSDLDNAPRQCSQETDESRGSALEPLGGEKQLTIPKIRGHRNGQHICSLDEVDESPVPLGRKAYISKSKRHSHLERPSASSCEVAAPGYTAYDSHSAPKTSVLPMNMSRDPSHRNGHIIDCFRSRHCPKLRDKAYTKSELGFRDHFAFLTPKRAVPTAYRPFTGLINTLHGSGTANFFAERKISQPIICEEQSSPDDPFMSSMRRNEHGQTPSMPLLVPVVFITPETRVVDTGYQNLWVAVEVTAYTGQPASDDRSSSEAVTSHSQKPSHYGEQCKTNRRHWN